MQKLRIDCSGLSPKETDHLIASLLVWLKSEPSDILLEPVNPICRKIILSAASESTGITDIWKIQASEEKNDLEEKKTGYEIPVDQILYVTSDRHYCAFRTLHGNFRTRLAFRDAAEMMPQELFLNCNRGILLSMKYIAGLSDGVFSMQDGASFPLRTKHKKEIIRKYELFRTSQIIS